MGPFPHDAPPPKISEDNPMGTDGFEFVEFCHPKPEELDRLFRTMGFSAVARHRAKQVTLYRQGDINFILNAEPNSFAQTFAGQHGPSAPAMAFRVVDARHAYHRALSLGARPAQTSASFSLSVRASPANTSGGQPASLPSTSASAAWSA